MSAGRAAAGAGAEGVRAHDQGFVAASPEAVYGALSDVRGYPAWWPGVAVTADGSGLAIRLPGWPPVAVRTEGHRPGVGLLLHLGGPIHGTLEWYLEPFQEGTVVNAILSVTLPGRTTRRLGRLRAAVRAGLVGLGRSLG